MTTLEILKAARVWLSKPRRWTKGSYARSKSGKTEYDAIELARQPERGACTCMLGALVKASKDDDVIINSRGIGKELSAAFGENDIYDCIRWNDAPERTHAEVLARFDEAIARLEG